MLLLLPPLLLFPLLLSSKRGASDSRNVIRVTGKFPRNAGNSSGIREYKQTSR